MDELVKPDNKILDYLTRYVPPRLELFTVLSDKGGMRRHGLAWASVWLRVSYHVCLHVTRGRPGHHSWKLPRCGAHPLPLLLSHLPVALR